jgi:hypothetical protein
MNHEIFADYLRHLHQQLLIGFSSFVTSTHRIGPMTSDNWLLTSSHSIGWFSVPQN